MLAEATNALAAQSWHVITCVTMQFLCYCLSFMAITACIMTSELVKEVHSTGSSSDNKYTGENAALTEMPDETGARLEHLPCKSLARLVQ
jgi:hypothetical protein